MDTLPKAGMMINLNVSFTRMRDEVINIISGNVYEGVSRHLNQKTE